MLTTKPDEKDSPGSGEGDRGEKNRDSPSRRTRPRAEDHDQRQQNRDLDTVGDDPQAGLPDRDGEGLRPAEHESDRGSHEQDPRGVGRRDGR